jgi:hypothetical protein
MARSAILLLGEPEQDCEADDHPDGDGTLFLYDERFDHLPEIRGDGGR